MNSEKFIGKWKKERKKGVILYICKYACLMPISSFVGRVIGVYLKKKSIDISVTSIDCITLLMLGGLGVFLAIYAWHKNEKKFKEQE